MKLKDIIRGFLITLAVSILVCGFIALVYWLVGDVEAICGLVIPCIFVPAGYLAYSLLKWIKEHFLN